MAREQSGIKFELRPRQRNTSNFWSVRYDVNDGRILGIEPGDHKSADRLTVSYAKIKDILSGQQNQENFVIGFDEKIGALDIIDVRKPHRARQKQNWASWLTCTDADNNESVDLRCLLFEDGKLRIESSRYWSTAVAENPNRLLDFPVYLTAADDPHMLLGAFKVSTSEMIEKGYVEKRLYSFIDSSAVDDILYGHQSIRLNVPPIAESLGLIRSQRYYSFTGIVDDQTAITHPGTGRHLTLFVKNNSVWAQSHYYPGSPIDDLMGPLRAGMFLDDPDNFLGWVEFPPLMLRQNAPFEIVPDWHDQRPPELLYKANNLDIGVVI